MTDIIHLRKTIASLELQFADNTKESNEKVCKLEEELRKLYASFEKNELSRQKLELQLTISQKEANQFKEKACNEEKNASNQISELKETIKLKEEEIKGIKAREVKEKQSLQNELDENASTISSLEELVGTLKNDNRSLYEERSRNNTQLQGLLMNLDDLESKCQVLEEQKINHTSTIDHLVREKNELTQENQRLIYKINDLDEDKKLLENKYENDKIKQKETEFNYEVLQLQIKDLEKELANVEKEKEDICENYEISKLKCSELAQKLSESQSVMNQIENVTNQYIGQLTENSQVVTQLTDELKVEREKNDELNKSLSNVSAKATKQESLLEHVQKTVKDFYLDYNTNGVDIGNENVISIMQDCFRKLNEKTQQLTLENEKYINQVREFAEKCKDYENKIKQLKDSCNTYQIEIEHFKGKCEELKKELLEQENNGEKALSHAKNIVKKNLLNILIGIKKLLECHDIANETDENLDLSELNRNIVTLIHEKNESARKQLQQNAGLEKQLDEISRELESRHSIIEKLKSQNEKLLKQAEENVVEVTQMVREEKEKTKQKYVTEMKRKHAEYQKKLSDQEILINKMKSSEKSNKHWYMKELETVTNRHEAERFQLEAIISFLWHDVTELLQDFQCLLYQKHFIMNWIKQLSHLKQDMNEMTCLLSGPENSKLKTMNDSPVKIISQLVDAKECENLKKNYKATLSILSRLKFETKDLLDQDTFQIETVFAKEHKKSMQQVKKKSRFNMYMSHFKYTLKTNKFNCEEKSGFNLPMSYRRCEDVTQMMNNVILGFTERLHESEVERQALRFSQENIIDEKNGLIQKFQDLSTKISSVQMGKTSLTSKIKELERELGGRPQQEEFKLACNDLSEALQREEELQELLQQQTKEIHEMNESIEHLEHDLKDKEVELSDALNSLLLAREQQSKLNKEVNKQKKYIEAKDDTFLNIRRETDLLVKFSLDINSILNKENSISERMLIELKKLLDEFGVSYDALYMPTFESGTVKGVVFRFGDAMNKLLQKIFNIRAEKHAMKSKMVALENDISAHRNHVNRLKQQITEVCQQEIPYPGVQR